MKAKGLSPSYLGDVVTIVVYLLNRCPAKVVRDITHEDVWTSWKPYVSHLRVFGSIAYAYIPIERGKKLDDKSRKHTLVWDNNASKVYRLLDPSNRGVIISMISSLLNIKMTKMKLKLKIKL